MSFGWGFFLGAVFSLAPLVLLHHSDWEDRA